MTGETEFREQVHSQTEFGNEGWARASTPSTPPLTGGPYKTAFRSAYLHHKVGGMPSQTVPPEKQRWLLALLLVLIVLAVYLPLLRNGFVYDSEEQVLNDSFIHTPANWPDVLSFRVLGRDVLDFNRPVNLASLMIDSFFWRKDPFGYHLTNLLLHLGVCLLLFFFLCNRVEPTLEGGAPATPGSSVNIGKGNDFGGSLGVSRSYARRRGSSALQGSCSDHPYRGPWKYLWAFFPVLLFGLHPVNLEPVTEVAFREDLLAAFFSLAGLLIVERFEGALPWALVGVFCFFLAAGSKETGMLTPVWLGAWYVLFRGKWGEEPSNTSLDRAGRCNRQFWGWILATTLVSVGILTFFRFYWAPTNSTIFVGQPHRLGGNFANTLWIQTRIWAFYFRQILFPTALCADYGPYSLRNFDFIPCLLGLLVVLGLQVYLACRSRLFAFGVATFWFFLLPVSNFIPMFRPMADRFLYFPMIGAAVMLATLHSRRCVGIARAGLLLLMGTAAVCFGRETLSREGVWHDNLALWKATLEANPGSLTAYNNLTEALVQAGKPEEALRYFQNASPAFIHNFTAESYASWALALEAVGKHEEADAAFKAAVSLDKRYATPNLLVKALTWTRQDADKLQSIANRN